MTRTFIAACAAALVGLACVTTDVSARPGGGFRAGGFAGGGFRAGGFAGGGFRAGGFRTGGFRAGFAPGFRGGYWRGPGFRRFGPGIGLGVGLGLGLGYPYYYAGYPYAYDGCVVPRRIWTPYGPRIRYVNVCYGYY